MLEPVFATEDLETRCDDVAAEAMQHPVKITKDGTPVVVLMTEAYYDWLLECARAKRDDAITA